MGKSLFKSAKQIAVDAYALKLAMQRGNKVSSDKSTVKYEDEYSAYINTVLPDVVVTPKYKDYDDYNKTIAARDKRALEQQQREMNNYVRAGMNKAGEVVAGAMMMLPPVAAADPIAAGVGRILRFAAPKLRAAARASQVATNNASNETPEVIHFYHGSPVRFDAFNADFIGSGEGGSKVMKGINLWPEERIANAPKFANINSPDAPLHLGVPSKPLGGELNPTVYDVSGRGLNLYTATPREVKGLSQSDLVSQGYDGIRTPSQVTVFPESIDKLSIDKQSTIEEFVRAHPEVEKWTPWTTDAQKMQNIVDVSKMSRWTPEQWTAAQDAAIARGDIAEAQRLRDLHFKVSAPNTKTDVPLWSSSEEAFNSFDLSHFGETDSGFFGYGHYLTPIEKYAATYHPINRKFYANIKNPYIGNNDQHFNRMQYVKDRLAVRKENVMRNFRNGKITKFSKKLGINEDISLEDAERLADKYVADETAKWNDRYVKYADEFEGKDGVLSWRELQGVPNKQEGIYKEVVVPKGEQIKSADAVTYDDNGVRIPLGQRDNFNMNDIRYALPFVLPSSKLSVEDEVDDTQLNN